MIIMITNTNDTDTALVFETPGAISIGTDSTPADSVTINATSTVINGDLTVVGENIKLDTINSVTIDTIMGLNNEFADETNSNDCGILIKRGTT